MATVDRILDTNPQVTDTFPFIHADPFIQLSIFSLLKANVSPELICTESAQYSYFCASQLMGSVVIVHWNRHVNEI